MDFLRKVCTYFIISEICCATCHILPWNHTTFLKQKFKWLEKKPHRIQSSDKAVVVAVSTHQGST